MGTNLIDVLDEIIVLHARIATEILNEFPDVFGLRFLLDANPPFAFAVSDVPQDYAPEYTHRGVESKSRELLASIAPRIEQIVASTAPIGVRLRDFFVTAERAKLDGENLKNSLHVNGAISGGLGAVVVRRSMLASNDRVVAYQPAEFHALAIAEDPADVPLIREAGNSGLRAGMKHVIDRGLFLNRPYNDAPMLLNWTDHFPAQSDTCEMVYDKPVCRLIAKSDHHKVVLYVPAGSLEGVTSEGIVEYDAARGFDIERHSAPAAILSPGR
jgi:hypothetical protein|nr:hypothetical protein [Neorhizobium tomejilense]